MKKRIHCCISQMLPWQPITSTCSSKNDAETASSDTKAKKEETKKGSTKVILNEVAHSIFYAPMYVAIEEGYFADEGIEFSIFVTGFGADKTSDCRPFQAHDIGFTGQKPSHLQRGCQRLRRQLRYRLIYSNRTLAAGRDARLHSGMINKGKIWRPQAKRHA